MKAQAVKQPARWLPAGILAWGAGLASATGLACLRSPFLGLALAGCLGAVAAVLARPDFAVSAVIFLLYSNLPVVGATFHGVPKVLAAAFPLLLLVPLGRDLVVRRAPVVLTPTFALLLLWLAVQAAGAAFASYGDRALELTWTFALEGVLLYLLVVNVVRTPATLRGATTALIAAGVLMSAVPLFQQLTGTFASNYGGLAQIDDGVGFTAGESRQARLAGPIGEKNRFAQVLLVLLPLALGRCFSARGAWARSAAAGATLSITLGFALAFSRGGAIGLACLVVAMLALRAIDAKKALLLAGAVGLTLLAMPQYLQRLGTIGSSVQVLNEDTAAAADGAVRRRLTVMHAALRMFLDHPLIGVGPGMFMTHSMEYGNQQGLRRLDTERRAHCLYLEVAAENGALGLGLLLAALGVTAHGLALSRRTARDPELRDLSTAYLLALVAYLATAMFLHLSYLRYFCLLLGLCDAAARVGLRAAEPRVPTTRAAIPGVPA